VQQIDAEAGFSEEKINKDPDKTARTISFRKIPEVINFNIVSPLSN
jgi:hypothetical protein